MTCLSAEPLACSASECTCVHSAEACSHKHPHCDFSLAMMCPCMHPGVVRALYWPQALRTCTVRTQVLAPVASARELCVLSAAMRDMSAPSSCVASF